jgi:hypothetical protein
MTLLQKCRKAFWALVLAIVGAGVGRADIKTTALDDKGRFARIEVSPIHFCLRLVDGRLMTSPYFRRQVMTSTKRYVHVA